MKRPRPPYLMMQRSPSMPLDSPSRRAPRRRSSFIPSNSASTAVGKRLSPIPRIHSYDDSCISTSSSDTTHSSQERLHNQSLLVQSGEDVGPEQSIRRRKSHLIVYKQLKRRKSRRKTKSQRFRHVSGPTILAIVLGLFAMSFAMSFLGRSDWLSDPPTAAPQPSRDLRPKKSIPDHHKHTLRRTSLGSGSSSTDTATLPLPNKKPIVQNIAPGGLRGSNDEPFVKTTVGAPQCSNILTEVSFTVVTQLSTNRLWMMEHHCKRWHHPISMALYVGDDSRHLTVHTIELELENMGCQVGQVAVSLVGGYSEQEYPVNVLRNTALSKVQSSHVVYLDVDFWPSIDLHETLQQHTQLLVQNPKQALVLPAFQLHRQCRDVRECPEVNVPHMPHTKADLLDLMVKHHSASAFDPTNFGGHGSTHYKEWLSQHTDELVDISCVNSNRYEPYLVFRYCEDLAPFQNAFTGYGKNKMTWIMQLRRSGYRFSQVGTSFVVHYPHLDSKARLHWNGGEQGLQIQRPDHIGDNQLKRSQVDRTFVKFRKWLEHNVPDQTIVGKCKHAMNDDANLWVDR